jgi:hypothetical protein
VLAGLEHAVLEEAVDHLLDAASVGGPRVAGEQVSDASRAISSVRSISRVIGSSSRGSGGRAQARRGGGRAPGRPVARVVVACLRLVGSWTVRQVGVKGRSRSCQWRSASARTSRTGRPARAATAAASSNSALARPGLTLTRTDRPSTTTRSWWRGASPPLELGADAEGARLVLPSTRATWAASAGSTRALSTVCGAALLHHDRGEPRVVRAGVEGGADRVGEDLAGGVVDVGLEQHHGLAVVGRGGSGRVAACRAPPG